MPGRTSAPRPLRRRLRPSRPHAFGSSACTNGGRPRSCASAVPSSSNGCTTSRRTSSPRGPRGGGGAGGGRRERGVGPWSVGVVCLEGLGRPERGLVGDLALVKLMSDLRGRWVEGHETAELLEPYGEGGGLASVYLTLGYARGLVPLPGARRSKPRAFFRTIPSA